MYAEMLSFNMWKFARIIMSPRLGLENIGLPVKRCHIAEPEDVTEGSGSGIKSCHKLHAVDVSRLPVIDTHQSSVGPGYTITHRYPKATAGSPLQVADIEDIVNEEDQVRAQAWAALAS